MTQRAEERAYARRPFVCVQSVVSNGRGSLWVLDPAAPGQQQVIEGGPKLVRIDLSSNAVAQTILFDTELAPQGSYLSDVRFHPNGRTAYITESGAKCALLVVDLASGSARRALDGHPSTQPEKDVVVKIDGEPLRRPDGRGAEFAADSIEVTPDGAYVVYEALTGRRVYRIPTSALDDADRTDEDLGARVETLAVIGVSDGYWVGEGDRLFMSAVEENAVKVREPSGEVRNFVQDERLRWPDSFAHGPDGGIYVTTSHIQDSMWFKPEAGPAIRTQLWRADQRAEHKRGARAHRRRWATSHDPATRPLMTRAPWLLILLLLGLPASARAEPVGLTFDDVPGFSVTPSPRYALITNRRLTRRLVQLRLPATGFVVGGKFKDRPRVRRRLLATWRQRGLVLGNHTYSHLSLNDATPKAYLADTDRNDRLLRRVNGAGGDWRWFRFPYLETGRTEAARQAVADGLASRGYKAAPVTLENDDDTFAPVYDDAVLRGDRRRMAKVRATYLAFTAARIEWYRAAAVTLLDRRPSLVFLMHDTRLNADCVSSLAHLLRRSGLQPVSLAAALSDPAYALPDGPATADGDDWLNRWAVVLKRDLPWDSFPEVPADIAQAAARLDHAP